MTPPTPTRVREFAPRGAFVTELRNLMERHGVDVPGLAAGTGMDRTRLHQVLSHATPPPGPEIVEQVARNLKLEAPARRCLHWLAIRDRTDPHSRVLLELYESRLMEAWKSKDARAIPERLGDDLDWANFVIANRPVYLRSLNAPVHARVHDEQGRMHQSLVDGWIVQVEPAGLHGKKFLSKAVNHVVIVNVGRQCRIGWLREDGDDYVLHGDDNKPLTQSPKSKSRRSAPLVIARTSAPRPGVEDIQAFIAAKTLDEIEGKRSELRCADEERRRQQLAERIHTIRPLQREGGSE